MSPFYFFFFAFPHLSVSPLSFWLTIFVFLFLCFTPLMSLCFSLFLSLCTYLMGEILPKMSQGWERSKFNLRFKVGELWETISLSRGLLISILFQQFNITLVGPNQTEQSFSPPTFMILSTDLWDPVSKVRLG